MTVRDHSIVFVSAGIGVNTHMCLLPLKYGLSTPKRGNKVSNFLLGGRIRFTSPGHILIHPDWSA